MSILSRFRRIRLIIRILRELPEEQRQALMWFKLDRVPLPTIAARLKVSEPMARELIIDALAHCGKRLKELTPS